MPRVRAASVLGARPSVGPGPGRGAALALALLLAGPAQAVEVSSFLSLRSELRLRSPIAGELPTGAFPLAFDLEFVPLVLVGLRWPSTTLTVQYSPDVILRNPHLLGPVGLEHRGRVQLRQTFAHAALSLTQEGSTGSADITSLRTPEGTAAGSAGEVQTVGLVPFVRSASWAALDGTPSEAVGYQVSLGYLISGSPQDPLTLPLQWGPSGLARLRLRLDRLDHLSTQAQAQAAWFVVGHRQLITALTETWERQLTQSVTASVGGGVAFTREHIAEVTGLANPPIPGDYQEVLPVVNASVDWRQRLSGALVLASAGVRMAPFADRFTGQVYERLEARAQGQWRPERALTVTGAAGLAYAVPVGRAVQAGDTVAYFEGTVAWPLETWATLGVLGRVMYLEQPRLGIAGYFQGLVSVSMTLQHRATTVW